MNGKTEGGLHHETVLQMHEFDEKLCQLKDVWNEREMEARKTSLPEFHAWFTRYHATNMK